ncbi:MAG: hypothetical protein HQK51_20335, partial [Oligoflexia bacterium]|nr:hypothetical protein [Oligoflexia bacterium]
MKGYFVIKSFLLLSLLGILSCLYSTSFASSSLSASSSSPLQIKNYVF